MANDIPNPIDLKTIYDTQVILMARLNRIELKYDLLAEKLGIPDWDIYDNIINDKEVIEAMHTIARSLLNKNL